MTTFSSTYVTCGACGQNFEHNALSSTNRFGSMDLDTRPPEMERSTMNAWIQRCPGCGHCASDASVFDRRLMVLLESENYQGNLVDPNLPPLSAQFVCAGLLLEAALEFVKAGWEFLHAAWVTDDANLANESRKWRTRAAECFGRCLESAELSNEFAIELSAVQVDCLRRANRGKEAAPIIDRLQAEARNPVIDQVMVYQRRLIMNGDNAAHTVSEAMSTRT
ncbi:MAG: hypothetical protein KA257_05850 [Opitutaceae bacterium]|nr:hypothetical protein [Opitutaceae bacterium]MBP9911895.1 hypothetical protein [Opitutaceae bacterium]